MKCFHYFKDRNRRSTEQRSAPMLNEHGKSDVSATSTRGIPELYEEKAQNLRVFSFSELSQATDNFSRLLKIGEGGFGSVYKGTIKPVDEVQFLGVVEHPNLVKLIGYCAVDGERGIQRLLVYEFMSNKSLEDHLFSKSYPALPLQRRLQIVLGAALGLAYLHEESEAQVIYRDFKSSNVLLNEDFKPKLSDFGLAREGPTGEHTHVSTAVVGTYGYAAPDYIETGRLTTKSDVWSFGVVLYEILTGRRSLERNRPRTEQKLLEWIKHFPVDGKKFGMIMDPRLENQYSLSAARGIAKLADTCLMKSAKDRPKMSEVVESLKQIMHTSDVGSSLEKSSGNDEHIDSNKTGNQMDASVSSRRRIAHLAKLSEHVGGISRRGFMVIKRAKVP
ncbi:hypothetical protein RJ640_000794 [Escallonia rubra]|uniref:Protein kinase domain-containing protein n=1 Tax=Escallonia rubra TaxID=112253 RepID=A0AA88RFP6_9ASTE|nr:hypothetical protein RJ640_000794 [Escallonia rubra]